MIESALEAGFASAGVDVLLTGPLPTPGVAYLTRALRVDLGVVISASHNPFGDNGVKFFSASGEKLPDAVGDGRRGRAGRAAAVGRLGRARQGAPPGRRRRPLPRVLQEHVLAGAVAQGPEDRRRWRARRGLPRGARACSTSWAPRWWPSAASPTASTSTTRSAPPRRRRWCEAVRQHGADYGVALDGDADRLQMVDAQRPLLRRRRAALRRRGRPPRARRSPCRGVVGTLMTNMAVEQALRGARRAAGARQGGRSLHPGGAAGPRLAAGRRELGPPAGARPPHHRRRHRQRAAGAAGDPPHRAVAAGAAGRRPAVPAGDDQRAAGGPLRLAAERDAGGREGARSSTNWAATAAC